jgi:predicted phosphodiesterase
MKYVTQADEVWHAGDIGDLVVTDTIKIKPLRAVYGNIDDDKARFGFPLNNRFWCEGVDVGLLIGVIPVNNPKIKSELETNPQLFICGHSHILKVCLIKE